MSQNLKRKNQKQADKTDYISSENKKRKNKDMEDEEEEFEDCSMSEEEEQKEQIQEKKTKKSKKNKSQNKKVTFESEDDDLKNDVDKADLKYEDDHYDEYEKEEIVEEDEEDMEEKDQKKQKTTPFLGTDKDLAEDEELEMDNRAYDMYHRANVEWPCLSFDYLLPQEDPYFLHNPGFQTNNKYPLESYMVTGTQSGTLENYIYLVHMANMHKTKYDDDSDYQNSDDEGNDEEPVIRVEQIQIKNNVNRIRAMQHLPIVAFWQDNGDLSIVDLKNKFSAMYDVNNEEYKQVLASKKSNKSNSLEHIKGNTKTFKNSSEGYGLDWSYLKTGYLLTGSCDSKISLYHPRNQGFSDIVRESNPFVYHQDSVEDLQWSPKDENEFASCSVDGTVQFADIRTKDKKKSQILIKAHTTDVNVISWCRANPFLLVSGADNGEVKVWDKRYPKNAYTEIDFHKEPITSVQFQPSDESTISVTSADNRLTIWDLAVENDDTQNNKDLDVTIPDQLMFIHQGQKDMKELRYHPIYTEIIGCTAADGFNLFKPALDANQSSIRSDSEVDEGEIPQINEKDLDQLVGQMSINEN